MQNRALADYHRGPIIVVRLLGLWLALSSVASLVALSQMRRVQTEFFDGALALQAPGMLWTGPVFQFAVGLGLWFIAARLVLFASSDL